jgi:hypothetical protein
VAVAVALGIACALRGARAGVGVPNAQSPGRWWRFGRGRIAVTATGPRCLKSNTTQCHYIAMALVPCHGEDDQ